MGRETGVRHIMGKRDRSEPYHGHWTRACMGTETPYHEEGSHSMEEGDVACGRKTCLGEGRHSMGLGYTRLGVGRYCILWPRRHDSG